MNQKDFVGRLAKLQTLLDDSDFKQSLSLIACKSVEADVKTRVFGDGGATDGSKIGDYSTKPIYVNPAKTVGLPKFAPDKGKSGKPHKTKYFGDGYAGFRKTVGRQTGYVDTELTGDLRLSLQTGTANGRIVFGFTNAKNAGKAAGLEKRFGKAIYTPSDIERKTALDAANAEIKFRLAEI